ncbi:tRNA-specific 2-thiouridylase [Lipomyces arxii]|uniref:tRNA-specific 2-thiouridylase n=1 Tax=Lipomyces arxii TaxID=56418 RepID=UPI0034CFE024
MPVIGRTIKSTSGWNLLHFRSLHSTAYRRSSTVYTDPVPGPDDAIFVAMSGGVDSSFVAHLLSKQYKNVTGVYMANWTQPRTPRKDIPKMISPRISGDSERLRQYMQEEEKRQAAEVDGGVLCTETEWNDVQLVCRDLDIPSIRMSFEKEYWTDVFEPMINGFINGNTPNPDVTCNRLIKFGVLYENVEKLAAQKGHKRWWLAMGHYARIAIHKQTGQYHLLRPRDSSKDQTYYLSTIDSNRMGNILFPLHCYNKKEIRKMAEAVGLRTAYKPDSHGLCFIQPSVSAEAAAKAHHEGKKISSIARGYTHFRDFLREYVTEKEGNIVLLDGTVVGTHPGLWYVTIGQRSGLNMGSVLPSTAPWYVVDKRVDTNEIVIATGVDNPMSYSSGVICQWYWMVEQGERQNMVTLAQSGQLGFRYRSLHEPMPVKSLAVLPDGKVQVEFADPAHGVVCGQYLAVYHGDRVVGSGPIESKELSYPEEIEKMKQELILAREQTKQRQQTSRIKLRVIKREKASLSM